MKVLIDSLRSKFAAQKCIGISHELCETSLTAVTIVWGRILPIVEVEEGGEPSDIMFLAQRLILGAVEGSKGYLLVVNELLSCSSVLWFGCLAMTTPWGIEHDQTVLTLLQE